jgi:hypothetical protein
VPLAIETATKSLFQKQQYKRFRFDFYKQNGSTDSPEKVLLRPDKKNKRSQVPYFLLSLGNDVEIAIKLGDVTFK